MKILVCGGRDFADASLFKRTMMAVAEEEDATMIIHGGAKGADAFASQWCRSHCIPELRVDADWVRHGKSAGPKRNWLMLELVRPDVVVAFPGGNGTADMVKRATQQKIRVVEVNP